MRLLGPDLSGARVINVMLMITASRLSDTELAAELGRLAGAEREATAALIVHLAEFDARRLYEGAGYSSMFQYGRAVLRLSEDAVYNRIAAARAARRFPAIVGMLATGALSPTTARLRARHLAPENHEALLAAASGLGKLAIEELLARWFPQPDVAPRIRRLPASSASLDLPPAAPVMSSVSVAVAPNPTLLPLPSPTATAVVARPAVVRPLAAERFEVRFTASGEMRERLREAQDLLGHAVPSGDLAQVFDRACARAPGRGSEAAQVRSHAASGQESARQRRCSETGRRGTAGGDRSGCRPVHLRGSGWASVRRAASSRVSSHPATRGRRPRQRGQHPASVSCPNGYEVDRFFGPGRRYSRERAERRTRSGTSLGGEWRTPPPAG
jgi:hypothetical protein